MAGEPDIAERDSRESGRLRREFEPRSVRAAHDDGELLERGIAEPVMLEERVEAAKLAVVREVHVGDVVGHRVALFRGVEHLLRWHVQELRLRIDEARNEPGTGDAVDLGSLARHPSGAGVERLVIERPLRFLPRLEAALEVARGDAGIVEGRRRSLAHLAPVYAIDDYRARARR